MKRRIIAVVISVLCIFTLVGCELVSVKGIYEPGTVTKENAPGYLDDYVITVRESAKVKGEIPAPDYTEETLDMSAFMYELPDISGYELDVKGEGKIDVEIFLPLENNGSSMREVISYAAKAFNAEKYEIEGKTVSVSVRCLESSLAEDYIVNGAYYPNGYIAANELYGVLMQEKGIPVSIVSEKTIGNTMGIAIKKDKYDELSQKYGKVDISTIIAANVNGDMSVGYTNPTNNPTGLNFVLSTLNYFDASNPMSMEATTDFSNFQNTVPLVSYSTDQMKSAVKSGTIDGFVIERQAYEVAEGTKDEFVFIPFGVRHDNPLYAVGNLTTEESGVLKMFAEYFENEDIQQYASSLGFNIDGDYVSTVSDYTGGMITSVLEYWKQGKASGKKIVAVFVADKSGSMDSGKRLPKLKESLKNAMQYIGEEAMVGLISYESGVYIDLPIGKFDTEQKEYFVGAVNSWKAYGGTATNDALIVALRLIEAEKAKDPNIKPIIILLSDGQTQSGYRFDSMSELIDVLDVPIYTIGYETDGSELERIAEINHGEFINATSDDVSYILKTLFNAEI